MISALLRPPRDALLVADVIRLLTALSIVVALLWFEPLNAVSIAFAAVVTLLPRALAVRPALDIALSIVIPIASWSAVLKLYETTRWWDIPVHFTFNGLLAAVAYIILARLDVVPDSRELPRPMFSAVVTVTALGLSLGVIWELIEWFVRMYVDPETFVGYTDTLGDLVAGGLGSALAGAFIRFLAHDGSPRTGEPGVPAATADRIPTSR